MTQYDETWLSAEAAAQVLRMSARQVSRYGSAGRIRIKRSGRRILYLSSDVAKLADELNVDERPLPTAREADQQIVQAVRQGFDSFDERQQRIEQQLDEGQRRIEERLERLEQHVTQPAKGPNWMLVIVLVLVLAIALVVLVIVLRVIF